MGDAPEADPENDVPGREVRPDGGWTSLDSVLDVLANQRRRYALYYLQDETTATLREIATQVAAWEHENGVKENPSSEVVYTEFYHQHLPKLANANVVEYDPREELVRYDGSELLEHVLDLVRWIERPDDAVG